MEQSATATPAALEGAPNYNLSDPSLYLNRELTWLAFNQRVLHEARDERTPLLERLKFIAIVGGNLDEFFMKRIGGLKQQVAAGVSGRSVDGRTAEEQIRDCGVVTRALEEEQQRGLKQILTLLTQYDIRLLRYAELDDAQREQLEQHFMEAVFPLLTPLALDPGHRFPFISNLSLNLLVELRYPNAGAEESLLARVKIPIGAGLKRFVKVGDSHHYLPLEELVEAHLERLFPGMEIVSVDRFRITRNANVMGSDEADTLLDDADDLTEVIETELRGRHFAPIVRLQYSTGMAPQHRGMLAAELSLDEEQDLSAVDGLLGFKDLWQLVGIDIPELHDAPHRVLDNARLAFDNRSIFHIVRKGGPLLLQHPYESFTTSVQRFLKSAAEDPKVLAIKMTLYRTDASGQLIESLLEASRRGKQVAVLVELKARFDEEANLKWARRLGEAGIHVAYGVIGLKTHSKIILVVRQDYNGIRRYAHIGTGNYHPGTARLYSDLGMLTNDEAIGEDLNELFNYLTGYGTPAQYRKLLPAPFLLKRAIITKIEREVRHQREGRGGLIQMKMNALEDVDVTRALYRAGQAGVKVDLIVRDSCRLRPGLPGLSESIRVIGIVGRFLEHARIFYFQNGGEEEYYMGSADLMKRNLEERVEVVTPIEEPRMRAELRMIIDAQLGDQRSAWEMQSDGTYRQRQPREGSSRSLQEMMIEAAEKRLSAVSTHKQSKIRTRLLTYFKRRAANSTGGDE